MAEQQDYDSPWKDILDLQFEEFMAFFFPTAHAQIDWRAGGPASSAMSCWAPSW